MWRDDPASVRPMLATTGTAPLSTGGILYERKYDGIRAIVSVEPSRAEAVRLWSRLGNEKTAQFPELAAGLRACGFRNPVIIDGEIVAVDSHAVPVGFQRLQGRMHLESPRPGAPQEVAFIAFDLLRDGDEDLRKRPLRERRQRLEKLIAGVTDSRIRLSETSIGDGAGLRARADAEGWEGLIAKRLDSTYASGRRSPDWRKLKFIRHQTCVVGGWTEPRGSRPYFGALILGVFDERGALRPVGHSGSGFSDAELERVWKRLAPLERRTCPFATVPPTNERPHWVEPQLLAEVKFTEWTSDGQLRHPTYLGLRDDAAVGQVRREPDTVIRRQLPSSRQPTMTPTPKAPLSKSAVQTLLGQIDAIEHGKGSGILQLPSGERLDVSNLGKVFWPKVKLTKGDLFRHYVRVAPYLLPVLADRPLVMKRYPNGIDAKPFYQQRAPDAYPAGVRIEKVTVEDESMPRLIGGSLLTLLYTVQLAAISQDPWLSRVQSADIIDHAAIDLDPPDEMPFKHVRDVARWVRDELAALKVTAFPKLSGAGGLHIYVPMPPDTPYEAGMLFCQIVATIVSTKHPKVATVERMTKARGNRIYVDYLQNGRGKTLASVYSARSNEFAGVSTPVTWEEIDQGVKPQDFTIRNFAARLESVGDLWAGLRKSKGADLRSVMKYAKS
jgi:bifunctional non-homologous end joining protein LigD